MLQDPRARVKVAEFHEQYALQGEATRWSEAAHDPALFPQFKTTMVPMLTDEAKKFFDYITFDAQGNVPGPDDEADRLREHRTSRRSTASPARSAPT